MTEPKTRKQAVSEENVTPANLWTRIKAQCLNTNPFISQDENGRRVVECPRCGNKDLEMNFTILSVQPAAVEWSATIIKCQACAHLMAFVT